MTGAEVQGGNKKPASSGERHRCSEMADAVGIKSVVEKLKAQNPNPFRYEKISGLLNHIAKFALDSAFIHSLKSLTGLFLPSLSLYMVYMFIKTHTRITLVEIFFFFSPYSLLLVLFRFSF